MALPTMPQWPATWMVAVRSEDTGEDGAAAYLCHAISIALNGIWFSIRRFMSACLLAC